jgi:signal transduction histidine kinase
MGLKTAPGFTRTDRGTQEANQIVALAAHGLRGPVGTIAMLAELLEEEDSDGLTSGQRELISNIRSVSESVLNLIDDLLGVSVDTCMQVQEVGRLVEESIALNRNLAESGQVGLLVENDVKALTAMFDQPKMLRVFTELIRDAIQSSRPGNSVLVGLHSRGRYVTITVQNRKAGAPEVGFKLSHPFSGHPQVQPADQRALRLSLPMIERIVMAHNGRFRVLKRPGEGSKFVVSLPRA